MDEETESPALRWASLSALLVLLLWISYVPPRLWREGLKASSLVAGALVLPLSLLLLSLVLWGRLPRIVRSRLPSPPQGNGSAMATVSVLLLCASLTLVVGMGGILEIVRLGESYLVGSPSLPILEASRTALLVGGGTNFFLLVLPPLLWIRSFEAQGWREILSRVFLSSPPSLRSVVRGTLYGVGLVFALGGLGALLEGAQVHVPENEVARSIARSLDLSTALFVLVLGALGEEIFFRGFLDPRVGTLRQSILFSLAHGAYGNALEILVTFALGFVLSHLRRTGGDLWGPIFAHGAFNALMILASRA